jgi:hypothetical protein
VEELAGDERGRVEVGRHYGVARDEQLQGGLGQRELVEKDERVDDDDRDRHDGGGSGRDDVADREHVWSSIRERSAAQRRRDVHPT